ncbi:MAG: hypothetical protein K8F91_13725 [Candidatus Obscuribacterales bacterium]|nr:hypothetical protein [Candidatus Obscuribacterales bacterium]
MFSAPVPAEGEDGLIPHQLMYEGLSRRYFVHAPPGYHPGHPVAVVILFHQDGANGKEIASLSQLNRIADQNGFLAVYPDAVQGVWNDGRGVNRHYQFDDVGFVDRLIRELQQKWNADSTRVYAAGFDGGGFFAQYLALKLPGKLAALASCAATLPAVVANQFRPRRPIPVFFILGMDDQVVPFKEAEKRQKKRQKKQQKSRPPYLFASEAVNYWLMGNKCSQRAEQGMLNDVDETDQTRVRWLRYGVCSQGSEVQLFGVEGGGHTWPGGYKNEKERSVGKTCKDIDASHEIWRFFSKHKLDDPRI